MSCACIHTAPTLNLLSRLQRGLLSKMVSSYIIYLISKQSDSIMNDGGNQNMLIDGLSKIWKGQKPTLKTFSLIIDGISGIVGLQRCLLGFWIVTDLRDDKYTSTYHLASSKHNTECY